MQKLKVGDLLISNCCANVWDHPGDAMCSTIIDYIDEQQHVLVINVNDRIYRGTNFTEIEVLTPSGITGWIDMGNLAESWVLV